MKERPILFSAPMIIALLAGRKTMTRRIVRWSEKAVNADGCKLFEASDGGWWPYNCSDGDETPISCPYGAPGERLWVRETWDFRPWDDPIIRIGYAADGATWDTSAYPRDWRPTIHGKQRWRPSIFMPRWASRITLEVTGVRVERLLAITEEDARAEGIASLPLQQDERGCWWTADDSAGPSLHGRTPRDAFAKLWDSINGERADWASNPWTWVVEFKRVQP